MAKIREYNYQTEKDITEALCIKETIKKMVDNINENYLLKRIYNLVSYIYIYKTGKSISAIDQQEEIDVNITKKYLIIKEITELHNERTLRLIYLFIMGISRNNNKYSSIDQGDEIHE